VPAKTTGKGELRYTVVLAAMASGTKLPSMVIFKGLKDIPKGHFPNDVVVQVSEKGYMSFQMMNEWKRRTDGPWRAPSMIVLDSAPSRMKKTVSSSFKQHYNTHVAIIPGGMTPLLQPADVHWNKSFKSSMKERWLQWLAEGGEEYTRGGKRKSASYEMVV
jgi:hypothetical protein